jgi:hypothetical protein
MENERSSSFSSTMCDGFQGGEAMEVQEMVRALALVLEVGVEASQCQTLFSSFISKLCEAMLAASFACLSCQRRRRSVGGCYK